MSAPTFTQVLAAEVARMQHLHPEREGELARAHALILHGMVLPSADDPDTGQVLSSDGQKRYSVNGSCDCTAGQHGKGCKHLHAWKLYQYISRKLAAQAEAQPLVEFRQAETCESQVLPEAPCSVNLRAMLYGFEVQLTLRDVSEDTLIDRLAALVKTPGLKPVPKPQPRQSQWRKGGNA